MSDRNSSVIAFLVLSSVLMVAVCGRSVAEGNDPDSDPKPAADNATDAGQWRELLKSYQAYDLPLPPADAPLVATLYEMEMVEDRDLPIPLHRPRYLLGFLIRNADPAKNSLLLVGTEYFELQPEQVDSLIIIDPDKPFPGEIVMQNTWSAFPMNAGLPAAVQCHLRGWRALADQLLAAQAKSPDGYGHVESVFHQPAGKEQKLALKFVAWAHYGNQLTLPNSDRAEVLRQLVALSEREPSFQTPACMGIIRGLTTALEPSDAAPGSATRLVDDLVDLNAGLFGETFMLGLPEELASLARQGWDAMPVLIKSLADPRLTRSVSYSFDNAPPHLVTVGEAIGILVQQQAGDSGVSWLRNEHQQLLESDVTAWWNEAQKSSEEDYLLQTAVPRLPGITKPYTPLIERLKAKYPRRLADVYRNLLADRPDVSSWPLVLAIAVSDLSGREKLDLLGEGVRNPKLARQAEAVQAIAKVDKNAFERLLTRMLDDLPSATSGSYANCEQLEIVRVCRETHNREVWRALRDAAIRADIGIRMEIIGLIGDGTDYASQQRRRTWEFLFAFLEDKEIRDVGTSPDRYENCAAASWRKIEIRNWAAYLLARQFGLDVSAYSGARDVSADDWMQLREQVASRCDELWISPYIPTPEEEARAREALEAVGALFLESPDREERRLASVSFAGEKVRDTDLRHLRNLPTIEDVDLSGTSISDAGLKEMSPCRGIRVLDLSGTKITDTGLEQLAKLAGLRSLDLSQTAVSSEGLKKLESLIHLEQLDLSNTKVSDEGLPTLARMLSLESLSLMGTSITDTGLRDLPAVPRLEFLNLTGTAVSDAGLPSLGACRKLVSLTLSLTKVTDAGLSELSRLTSLERLFLFGLAITDQGAESLARCQKLKVLSLSGSELTDNGMCSIVQLRDLETLYLAQTGITDGGVAQLAALKNLAQLDVSGTSITDRALNSLRSFPKLERVTLTNTKITARAVEELRQGNPQIQILE